MESVYAFISLAALLGLAFLIMWATRPRCLIEGVLTYALSLSVTLVLLGYALSAVHLLNSPGWWTCGGLLLLIVVGIPAFLLAHHGGSSLDWRTAINAVEHRIRRALATRSYANTLLILLAVTVAIVALVSFALVLTLAPTTPDALAYHLARMAYYLQQGHLGYYNAGYWAQVSYPKVATILQLYAFLAGGREDALTQVVQFFAYLLCLPAIYGISRNLGAPRKASLFVALIFGLLTICIAEAVTAQNDLLLTAYVAACVYFLTAHRNERAHQGRYPLRLLALAAVAFALAAGVKATILPMLPSLGLIAGYALWRQYGEVPAIVWRAIAVAGLSLLIALALITAPAGYLDNFRRFGDPIGPRDARAALTNENLSPITALCDGGLNLLRYGVDFVSLDGMLPVPAVEAIQHTRDDAFKRLFNTLGVDLKSPAGASGNFPFEYKRDVGANENTSNFGPLGFLLIWPVVLVALFTCAPRREHTAEAGQAGMPVLPERRPPTRLFALAAVLPVIVSAFILPYDLFHGRFFMTAAVFAMPVLSLVRFPPKSLIGRIYVALVLVLGCFTALSSAAVRMGTVIFPFPYHGVVLQPPFMDSHTTQLTREAPSPLAFNVEMLVPKDATVAVDVGRPFPEYLLFGEHLTRRLIPIMSYQGVRLPIPPEADYLVVHESSPNHQTGDTLITEPNYPFGKIYLRALHPAATSAHK